MKIDNKLNQITCSKITCATSDSYLIGKNNYNPYDTNTVVVGVNNSYNSGGSSNVIIGANNNVYTGTYSVVLGSGINYSEYTDYRVIIGCYENYTFYDMYSGAVDLQKNVGYQVKENRSLSYSGYTPREIVYQTYENMSPYNNYGIMQIPTFNNQTIGVSARCVMKYNNSSGMGFSVKNALYSHIGGYLTYVGSSSELGAIADGSAYFDFSTTGDDILIYAYNNSGSYVEFNLNVRIYTVLEYTPSSS